MEPKKYIRYLILLIVLLTSMIFYSYTRNNISNNDQCSYGEKRDQQRSEFIIWESLSHIFLSSQ